MTNFLKLPLAILAVAGAVLANATDEGWHVSGQADVHFIAEFFAHKFVGRERSTRTQLKLENGPWSITGSYWFYPLCLYRELDETHIAYENGGVRLRLGRFMLPIGQLNWYDQWNNGFVTQPWLERHGFISSADLLRTVPGADATINTKEWEIKVGALDSKHELNRPMPTHIDRGSLRVAYAKDEFIVGGSVVADVEKIGKQQKLYGADFRWTKPNWSLRGQALWNNAGYDQSHGFHVDLSHRPKGWSDVTLVARYQAFREFNKFYRASHQLYVVGSKIRLPWDVSFAANYTWGPDMRAQFLGQAWSFIIWKTFRF